MFLKYSNFTKEDFLTFVMRLLEETGVAVVQEKAFGIEGCIGIACTQGLEILREGEKRVRVFIDGKGVKKK
ncbi:hypothetical protein PM10SUCC1_36930 [Propionigenium maris DSM 9537]|uniref:Uncharacterized protein n=1 Tax=Propionigenium maris DSM 9537 TaxID=1123000 RepID=A0A9W6GN96_9FUSO|nr:hypothetical protein [Propionigenium maris]GLI58179.1 hypothetical protein PM10SUCC1_36930 [Propionigenium maris DSM 9537]